MEYLIEKIPPMKYAFFGASLNVGVKVVAIFHLAFYSFFLIVMLTYAFMPYDDTTYNHTSISEQNEDKTEIPDITQHTTVTSRHHGEYTEKKNELYTIGIDGVTERIIEPTTSKIHQGSTVADKSEQTDKLHENQTISEPHSFLDDFSLDISGVRATYFLDYALFVQIFFSAYLLFGITKNRLDDVFMWLLVQYAFFAHSILIIILNIIFVFVLPAKIPGRYVFSFVVEELGIMGFEYYCMCIVYNYYKKEIGNQENERNDFIT